VGCGSGHILAWHHNLCSILPGSWWQPAMSPQMSCSINMLEKVKSELSQNCEWTYSCLRKCHWECNPLIGFMYGPWMHNVQVPRIPRSLGTEAVTCMRIAQIDTRIWEDRLLCPNQVALVRYWTEVTEWWYLCEDNAD